MNLPEFHSPACFLFPWSHPPANRFSPLVSCSVEPPLLRPDCFPSRGATYSAGRFPLRFLRATSPVQAATSIPSSHFLAAGPPPRRPCFLQQTVAVRGGPQLHIPSTSGSSNRSPIGSCPIGLAKPQVRIGLIYLLSGFGGTILSSLFIRNSISVGASGALFGLLGAMLSELITNWAIYTSKAAALLSLLAILVINLAVGILPYVDNFAHIGGFLAGFLLGFVLLLQPQFGWVDRQNLPAASQFKSKHRVHQYVLCVIALLLLIAGGSKGYTRSSGQEA